MPKVASIGEVMIELAPIAPTSPILTESSDANIECKTVSFAGDSYNTAITLARLGIETSYVTRLGADRYSSEILRRLKSEGVNTDAINLCKDKQPGLYMIQNIGGGERVFHYWRDQSAAKDLFKDNEETDRIGEYLSNQDWVYFSAISIAILDEQSRERLFDLLLNFKKSGGKIAYDSNFRPRLWRTVGDAQQASLRAVELADLALLTLDDEAELWGSDGDALSEAKSRYAEFNSAEIVFKRGADDIIVLQNGKETRIPVAPIHNVVDTTAAGDTFNAGYIASHIRGESATQSARLGSRCAGIVIQHRGGVIDKTLFLDALD